jgi:hypothetical protein
MFLLLFNCIYILSQSNEIEINSLISRYEKHEFDIYKYKKLVNSWNDLTKKYGYPEIPYDSISKTFRYEFIIQLDDINKETIYNRILEHASMNYDFLSNITDYQDYKSGKIILKIKIPVQSNNGKTVNYFFADRFTIVDNKLKIEVFKMNISYHYDVYDNGSAILTNYEHNYPLEEYFPITSVKNIHWEGRLKQLILFNKTIRDTHLELVQFIKSYEEDYLF